MTYKKLYEDALFKLDRSIITLGEFEEMIKPLDREVEQEPTAKNDLGVDLISRADVFQILWNYDYTNPSALIVKAIRELPSMTPQEPILDKIRAEIEKLQKMCDKNDLNLMAQYSAFGMVLDILDKYKAESEGKE